MAAKVSPKEAEKKKKTWCYLDDVTLMEGILYNRPMTCKRGGIESLWESIVLAVNSKKEKPGYFNVRQAKDRFKRLKENHAKGTLASMRASGVEEEYTTLNSLVEESIVLEKEAKDLRETAKDMEAKKKESLERGGAKLMKAACMRLSQREPEAERQSEDDEASSDAESVNELKTKSSSSTTPIKRRLKESSSSGISGKGSVRQKKQKWLDEFDANVKFDRELRVQEIELKKLEFREQKELREREMEMREREMEEKQQDRKMYMEMFKMYLETLSTKK